jgi:protein gp37
VSDKTKIEWADATWNPITGCTRISEACDNCYAIRMGKRGMWGYGIENEFHLHENRLEQPMSWKKPTRIFVGSMTDMLHPQVRKEWFFEVLDVIADARCQHHTFMMLTKRPECWDRAKWWMDEIWPGDSAANVNFEVLGHIPNLWIGVTAENQQRASERIPVLMDIPAAVRFVSVEPMIGPVDLLEWMGARPRLDWVICGAETGPGKRSMDAEWAFDLRDQCRHTGTPFFFKKDSCGNHMLNCHVHEDIPQ